MKKICIVAKNMMSGGTERVVAQLIPFFIEHGNAVTLILHDDRPIHYDIPIECKVVIIGKKSESTVMDKFLRYWTIRKNIIKNNPDIVLSMPEEIGIYVIGAMLGTGIPVVVSERNDPWRMPYKKITRILRRMLYPFAHGLIFQTSQAAMFFSESLQKKGIVLPNPLDGSRLPQPYSGKHEKIVVGAGRLDRQKNFALLIEAFAKFYENHNDYKLVIYGEGGERMALETFAAERLPIDVWSMPGRVTDLPERIGRCGIFVLSSDYEGMPNVLIEAMAVGAPVVSTDCAPGGAVTLIENGKNGLIVPVKDVNALAEGLTYLADHPTEAAVMADNALSIREVLDAKKVAAEWLEYLEKCAEM